MEDPMVLCDHRLEALHLVADAGDDQDGSLFEIVVELFLVVVFGIDDLFDYFRFDWLPSGVVVLLLVDPANTAGTSVLETVTVVKISKVDHHACLQVAAWILKRVNDDGISRGLVKDGVALHRVGNLENVGAGYWPQLGVRDHFDSSWLVVIKVVTGNPPDAW